jgi:hypothetical protein
MLSTIYGRIQIRPRERRKASPREGERQAWIEWQVIQQRRVVSRHDTKEQAVAWTKKRLADARDWRAVDVQG